MQPSSLGLGRALFCTPFFPLLLTWLCEPPPPPLSLFSPPSPPLLSPSLPPSLLSCSLLLARLILGMSQRITTELTKVLNSSFKARFLKPSASERRFSSWIGGSIMASLGSFQQLWISKSEFEEHGAAIVSRRCT